MGARRAAERVEVVAAVDDPTVHHRPEHELETAVAVIGTDYLLGGYSKGGEQYVFARWQPGSPPNVHRIPLTDIFEQAEIERAFADEEHCGADVFRVASIRVSLEGRVVLALGGDGERLGACQGTCAIAELDPTTLGIVQSQVVDEFDGACGLLLGDDGFAVASCCDSVHVLEPLHRRPARDSDPT